MRAALLKFLSIALVSLSPQCFACTDVVGWATAEPKWQEPSGEPPASPMIRVRRLERGDPTGKKPCGHKVFLELEVTSPMDNTIAGYLFTVPRGSRPYFHVPTVLTRPKQFDDGRLGFWFSWLEAPNSDGTLPPIDFRLRFSQVSDTGSVSAPIEVRIADSGGLLLSNDGTR